MPTYEYRCQSCRQAFAIERSMTDSSQVHCTLCASTEVSRIWNAVIKVGSTTAGARAGNNHNTQKNPVGSGGCGAHVCGSCH